MGKNVGIVAENGKFDANGHLSLSPFTNSAALSNSHKSATTWTELPSSNWKACEMDQSLAERILMLSMDLFPSGRVSISLLSLPEHFDQRELPFELEQL
jgi:hypothetical protein